MLTQLRSIPAVLLFATLVFAQGSPVEDFDHASSPPKATQIADHRLTDLVERQKPGDTQGLFATQQELAQYYREKGDSARARITDERAWAAQNASESEGQVAARQTTGKGPSVVGEYPCRSMGSRPCDTQTTISLRQDGTWGWRYVSGDYQVAGGQVTFKGAGLGSWGPAEIGPGTLTFTSGSQKVIFQKPSSAPASLAGSYVCATAPGGCQTGKAIEISFGRHLVLGSPRRVLFGRGKPSEIQRLEQRASGLGVLRYRPGSLDFPHQLRCLRMEAEAVADDC